MPGKRNSLIDVIQLFLDINLLLHDFFVLTVVRRLERIGEVRSLLIHHLNVHSHCLGNDQDIREDNSGVDQASISFHGLDGYRRCDFGGPAALEKVAIAFGLMVLGEISSSCRKA